MNFVLSICIPTFNRADMLRATLESMAASEAFVSGKIHIFISDNVSPDHTPQVCAEFAARYPEQVQFYRLAEAIPGDLNFERAMQGGRGTFQKLHTDKGPFAPGALDRLVDCLENCAPEIAAAVPLAESLPHGSAMLKTDRIEDLVDICSSRITDINLCCVRRTFLHTLPDPFRYWERHFSQLDILFRLLSAGHPVQVIGNIEIRSFRVLYGSARNNAQCFGHDYVSILHERYRSGELSRRLYQREKRWILFGTVLAYHFDFFQQYTEPRKIQPFFCWMDYFYYDWFFYVWLVWIGFYWMTSRVIPLHQACGWCKRQLQKRFSAGKDAAAGRPVKF